MRLHLNFCLDGSTLVRQAISRDMLAVHRSIAWMAELMRAHTPQACP
jgi:hypothetical protein